MTRMFADGEKKKMGAMSMVLRLSNYVRLPLAFIVLASWWGGATATYGQEDQLPKLAPGVLRTIPGLPEQAETVTGPLEMPGLAGDASAWDPHFLPKNQTLEQLARNVSLRRPVWQLEFSFKPMRILDVEGTDGRRQRIWYLLYRITNNGGYIKPVVAKDDFGNDLYTTATGSRTVRFFPMFAIRSHEYDKTYADRLIPGVNERIHAIEIRDPNITLHDSVSITKVPIKASTENVDRSYWAVATWPAIERRTDFFSVYVSGLSNAYRWDREEDGQSLLTYKTLQLNFWRPGDAVFEDDHEFRYGIPELPGDENDQRVLKMYQMPNNFEHRWVYLP